MGSISFVNKELFHFPQYRMRLLVKKGRIDSKYFKHVSYEYTLDVFDQHFALQR